MGVNKLEDFSGQYSATSGIWKYYSFSWTPNQVNKYMIKQYICDLAGNNVTGTTKRICNVTETPQPHIEIWAGDRRIGNKYDRLDPPICYKLKVRLTKEGQAMSEGIQFSITSVPSQNTSGHYLQDSGLMSTDQHGIAENTLFLGNEGGLYKVTATYTDDDNNTYDVVFEEYCFDDYEYSNLSTGHTHEKLNYPGAEIPGDGYDDYPDAYKDVKVEVDYYTDITHIGKEDIKSSLNSWLPDILWTAGLNVSYLEKDSINDKDGIDDAINTMPAHLNRQECKKLLAQYRNFDSAIHIIIGTSREVGRWGETYGQVIQYLWNENQGWGETGFTKDSCAHYGSGDLSYTQDYLDSCGIIIFGKEFPDPVLISPGWGSGLVWPLSWTIAHEIGHALGLTRHWVRGGVGDKGVMDIDVDFKGDGMYGDHNYFDIDDPDFPVGRLDGQWGIPHMLHYDAMNTRKVIGIQTIDFQN